MLYKFPTKIDRDMSGQPQNKESKDIDNISDFIFIILIYDTIKCDGEQGKGTSYMYDTSLPVWPSAYSNGRKQNTHCTDCLKQLHQENC